MKYPSLWHNVDEICRSTYKRKRPAEKKGKVYSPPARMKGVTAVRPASPHTAARTGRMAGRPGSLSSRQRGMSRTVLRRAPAGDAHELTLTLRTWASGVCASGGGVAGPCPVSRMLCDASDDDCDGVADGVRGITMGLSHDRPSIASGAGHAPPSQCSWAATMSSSSATMMYDGSVQWSSDIAATSVSMGGGSFTRALRLRRRFSIPSDAFLLVWLVPAICCLLLCSSSRVSLQPSTGAATSEAGATPVADVEPWTACTLDASSVSHRRDARNAMSYSGCWFMVEAAPSTEEGSAVASRWASGRCAHINKVSVVSRHESTVTLTLCSALPSVALRDRKLLDGPSKSQFNAE